MITSVQVEWNAAIGTDESRYSKPIIGSGTLGANPPVRLGHCQGMSGTFDLGTLV